jgi:hypothetical protein
MRKSTEGENHGQNTDKNTAGLRPPWPKGVSGNPGGRPKATPLSHACRELLVQPVPDDPARRTYADAIAQMLAEKRSLEIFVLHKN